MNATDSAREAPQTERIWRDDVHLVTERAAEWRPAVRSDPNRTCTASTSSAVALTSVPLMSSRIYPVRAPSADSSAMTATTSSTLLIGTFWRCFRGQAAVGSETRNAVALRRRAAVHRDEWSQREPSDRTPRPTRGSPRRLAQYACPCRQEMLLKSPERCASANCLWLGYRDLPVVRSRSACSVRSSVHFLSWRRRRRRCGRPRRSAHTRCPSAAWIAWAIS